MAPGKDFRVLVATDGSDHARAALATAIQFPWPVRTRVRVVVSQQSGGESRRSILSTTLAGGAEVAAVNRQVSERA